MSRMHSSSQALIRLPMLHAKTRVSCSAVRGGFQRGIGCRDRLCDDGRCEGLRDGEGLRWRGIAMARERADGGVSCSRLANMFLSVRCCGEFDLDFSMRCPISIGKEGTTAGSVCRFASLMDPLGATIAISDR
jgi:hypothetical protein